MEVLPVLDVLGGIVVHGIAGQRDRYRPIASRLTSSHEPLAVANAFRDELGLGSLYLADLDGIRNGRPNYLLYRQLIEDGFQLLVDPGIREPEEVTVLHEATTANVVVGLETCRSPTDLAAITIHQLNVTFSLDLFRSVPRLHDQSSGWSLHPEEIVRQAVQCHIGGIIVLDLSDVGMGTGGSTDSLCGGIRSEFPAVRLMAGGGVRGRNDLDRFRSLGVDAVLVASALHDGRLSRDDVQ